MIKAGGKLTHIIDGGRMTVTLTGELDHHSALSIREEADALIYRYRPEVFALDLSKIEFMDSSGLGFIMGRYALMRKLGGGFVMVDPNERVKKILSLTGIERMIKTETTKNQRKEKFEK